MNGLVHRNLLVFFRDRATVFFSLLAVLIVIGLYVLFLGDAWVGNMADIPHVRTLMDTWIMAGLLSVASITTTMGAFDTMVEDKAKKIEKDIIFSPLKRSSIVGGYVISSFVIGVIMSLATLVLAELYIVLRGGAFLSGVALVQTLGLILFSTLSNTVFLFFLVSCFSSPNAFSTASSIIGTLIGFLTGIYLPIGQLPPGIQWVVKLFPPSHSAALFRQVMLKDPMAASFAGAPEDAALSFKEYMGVVYRFDGHVTGAGESLIILGCFCVVFLALSVIKVSREKTR
ncbi:MAG: ABC transporter permease [Sphaerochaeta sp.]|jgi:multidrug/hemolysin transport system permease protein|nr:ABC transporter permease [Sphaerochaeta sp.]MCI2046076.1 ABC transporter permease [Sphaerochaeta sp.]